MIIKKKSNLTLRKKKNEKIKFLCILIVSFAVYRLGQSQLYHHN